MLPIYQYVLIGAGVLVLFILFWRARQLSIQELFVRLLGISVGLVLGILATAPLSQLPSPYGSYAPAIATVLAAVLLSWIASGHHDAIVATVPRLQSAPGRKPLAKAKGGSVATNRVLIDTSATIDGRIADIVSAGFIPGTLVAPKFMLAELQNIADSEDAMRRGRGRRGLDVLNRLREMPGVTIEVLDEDVPGVREVDAKLVTIASKYGWSILTTDYNLNKVAQIQGVKILNVNELSNAVRPEVLPGEDMVVKIVQLGKERGQGVGYLADGTMVVVDNGDKLIGQDVAVEITRAFQTVAGKMIFAAPRHIQPAPKPQAQQPRPIQPKPTPMPAPAPSPMIPAAPVTPVMPLAPAPVAPAPVAPAQQQPRRQPRPKPQFAHQPAATAARQPVMAPGAVVHPQTQPEPFVNGSVAVPRTRQQPRVPRQQPQGPAVADLSAPTRPQRPKRRHGSAAIEDRLVQANNQPQPPVNRPTNPSGNPAE